MGRPINHKKIGGNEEDSIAFRAYFTGAEESEWAYLVEQVSARRFRLHSTEGPAEEVFTLVGNEPENEGECAIYFYNNPGEQATAIAIMEPNSASVEEGDVITGGDGQYIRAVVGGTRVEGTDPVSIRFIVTDGEIASVTIVGEQSDYKYLTLPSNPVTLDNPLGGSPTVSVDWGVGGVTFINPGSNYDEAEPEFIVADGETGQDAYLNILATGDNGSFEDTTSINVHGGNYSAAPTVVFPAPGLGKEFVTKITKHLVTTETGSYKYFMVLNDDDFEFVQGENGRIQLID